MQAQYKLLTGSHRDEFVTVKFNSVTAVVNFPNQTKTLSLDTFHYLVNHHFLIYINDDRLKA